MRSPILASTPFALALLLAAAAHAQPVTQPEDAPQLAELRDDKRLAEALATITQDPAIHVDDPNARAQAQALMIEGVHQLQSHILDQALANFLEAYASFPSPKILLDIASTLRTMGRFADAANTYDRYLADPATGIARVEEVKQLLLDLDKHSTLLTVRVAPRGSQVSIDGGPFIAVGSTLVTRVHPGLHLVRVKRGSLVNEASINGFEGEQKAVQVAVKVETAESNDAALPDRVDGWLIAGTQYPTDSGTGRARRVRAGYAGPEVTPIMPANASGPDTEVIATASPRAHTTFGVIALARVVPFGDGSGAAGGLGIAYSPLDRFELEIEALRSQAWGGYLGARYRLLLGELRPYVATGLPAFQFVDSTTGSTTIALGLRIAGGVEYQLQPHLTLEADLGIEHYFGIDHALYMNKSPDATLFVPTLAIVGRL